MFGFPLPTPLDGSHGIDQLLGTNDDIMSEYDLLLQYMQFQIMRNILTDVVYEEEVPGIKRCDDELFFFEKGTLYTHDDAPTSKHQKETHDVFCLDPYTLNLYNYTHLSGPSVWLADQPISDLTIDGEHVYLTGNALSNLTVKAKQCIIFGGNASDANIDVERLYEMVIGGMFKSMIETYAGRISHRYTDDTTIAEFLEQQEAHIKAELDKAISHAQESDYYHVSVDVTQQQEEAVTSTPNDAPKTDESELTIDDFSTIRAYMEKWRVASKTHDPSKPYELEIIVGNLLWNTQEGIRLARLLEEMTGQQNIIQRAKRLLKETPAHEFAYALDELPFYLHIYQHAMHLDAKSDHQLIEEAKNVQQKVFWQAAVEKGDTDLANKIEDLSNTLLNSIQEVVNAETSRRSEQRFK